jgi:hypothetical protein
MRYDLVPRFSTAAVEAMQEELLEIDYKALLHEDLLEHEVRGRVCTPVSCNACQRCVILSAHGPTRATAGAVWNCAATALCLTQVAVRCKDSLSCPTDAALGFLPSRVIE